MGLVTFSSRVDVFGLMTPWLDVTHSGLMPSLLRSHLSAGVGPPPRLDELLMDLALA
jgi:hypothetical protein